MSHIETDRFGGGYAGRILDVDLTNRRVRALPLDRRLAELFLGSRGLNSWLLYQQMKPGADPLGPENILIFGVGPLTGTAFPTSGRFTVTARSPLTGILGDANSGGFFGAELKAAGWDHLIIRGQAAQPTALWIRDDQVELRDAAGLWGLDTWQTTDALIAEAGDHRLRVATIGPAGERLVRYAAIVNEHNRVAGRTGMGAVMGAKRLKAIAVRGTGRASVAEREAFRSNMRGLVHRLRADPGFAARSRYGTASLMALLSSQGVDSTRNSQASYFEGHEAIDAEALASGFWLESTGCYACPIRCSHTYRVQEGPYGGTVGEGPEYETLNALGSRLGNDDLPSILHANTLANRYGLDTMSLGGAIALAMECFEKGLLGPQDTDGLDVRWGNHAAMIELIHRIARREGIGNLLAEGTQRAARAIGAGAERYAMHVKGLEMPASDPRASPAAALSYAVSSRGGDHLRAGFVKYEKKWKPEDALRHVGAPEAVNRHTPEGKAALVRWHEDFVSVIDSLGVCVFISSSLTAITMADYALALRQATGLPVSEADLWQAGARIATVERLFNVQEGLTWADDTLPARFLDEPVPAGPAAGQVVQHLHHMVADYYRLRGWDESGIPGAQTLAELGLSEISVAGDRTLISGC